MAKEQKEQLHPVEETGSYETDPSREGENGEAAAPGGESKDLSEILYEKEREVQQLNDRLLRLAADFENTRKRLEREKSESISFANESLLRELLPVIDNLERALAHGEAEADLQGMLDGVRMTLKGFLGVMAKYGCTPFDSVGKPFDPNFHEALMQQESAEHPEKCVIQELQKGYTLNERLLRPASVIVSKGSDS